MKIIKNIGKGFQKININLSKILGAEKIKYKSYRKQGLECDKNGNRIEVKCNLCGRYILVCKKYNDYCHSGACFKERTGKEWKQAKEI